MVMTNSLNGTTDQSDSSWRNEYLKDILRLGPVTVVFTKKDGTERRMTCTLSPSLLPEKSLDEENNPTRKSNSEVLAVWDLDKNDWRSFRFDSIIGFSYGK